MKNSKLRLIVILAAFGLFAAACGTVESAETAVIPENVNEVSPLDIPVNNVTTGEVTTLLDTVGDDKPLLIWAYAPYCITCRGEAPEYDELALNDEFNVVGLGANNDIEYAKDFLDDTGVKNHTLLHDASLVAWPKLGITRYPQAILVDPSDLSKGGVNFSGTPGKQDVLDAMEQLNPGA